MIIRDSEYGYYARYGISMPGYTTSPPIIATPDTPTGIEDMTAAVLSTPGVEISQAPSDVECPAPVASMAKPWLIGTAVLVAVAWALGR